MYDFHHVIDRRNTRSLKWGNMEKVYQIDDASDILPMWVADMDFPAPPPILNAMRERLDHGIFGYSYICERCKNAIRSWLMKRFDWQTENDWMLFHHGVVPAIATVVETFTQPGDRIIVTPPIYPPFFHVPKNQQREVVYCELIEENGNYSLDFIAFEKHLQQNVKLFILCNPHNPGGIVWKEQDLRRMMELCAKYDVLVLSDEIHADLVFPGQKHIPIAKIAEETGGDVITCIAPTKTFNIAGVQAAVMITKDERLRRQLQQQALAHGNIELNAFAASAIIAAYEECEDWLDQLLVVLKQNMEYVINRLQTTLPTIRVNKPEATYLLWIDYRATGYSEQEIMERLLTKGKLALEPGTKYGEAGRGFLRMNIATPPSVVEDGVNRLIKSFE